MPGYRALELIGGHVTAPGATLTALTMNTGNSATIRNTDLNTNVALIQTWARTQAAGTWQIKSPKLHDNVQGIRYALDSADGSPLWVPGVWQRLVPQDNLTLNLAGSAVGGQIEQAFLLVYYESLPGAAARMIGPAELLSRTVNVWTTVVAVTPNAGGDWSGQVAINSAFDNFKANTDYAIVGYDVDVACGAVRLQGSDTGNYGVGGPGMTTGRWVTSRWFYHLSEELNVDLIPVFNSANKNAFLVDVAQNQAGAAVNVTVYLHELSGPGTQGNPVLKKN